jgi:hypothetical protein
MAEIMPAALGPSRVHGDAALDLDDIATPRVEARPALADRSELRPGRLSVFGRPVAPLRNSCGESVGKLARPEADCAIVIVSLPAFMREERTDSCESKGAGERIRTADRPLTRRMLCQAELHRPTRPRRLRHGTPARLPVRPCLG